MTRLSARSEERDALEVLKAGRRELALSVHLEQLLGNGGGNAMAVVRASGLRQVFDQLAEMRRSRFRGPVGVLIEVETPPVRNPLGLRRAVKGYLDLLWREASVIEDDAAIDHLIVLSRVGATSMPTVTMLCTPLSVLTSDFDRAMRVANEFWPEPEQAPAEFLDGEGIKPDPAAWGRCHFGKTDRELLLYDEEILWQLDELDAIEAEQLAEDPDALIDYSDAFAHDRELEDPDVRFDVRRALEARAAESRAHWLADQSIDARDRPGPPPPWIAEVRDRNLADVLTVDDDSPGCFILLAPPHEPGTSRQWRSEARRVFAKRIEQPGWRRARFPHPIALDIAVRGKTAGVKDIDNRAAEIVTEFTAAFADAGVVVGAYRAYRLPEAGTDDIRVRLLPMCRLRELATRLGEARAQIATNRRERTRPLESPAAPSSVTGRTHERLSTTD